MLPRKILHKQLGELLLEQNVIKQEQLDLALEVQKQKGGLLGEILIQLNFTREEDIAQCLTVQYGYPYLPLGNYEVSIDVGKLVPEKLARQYAAIPIDKIGNSLILAMANPLNEEALERIEKASGCITQVFVSTLSDVRKAIDTYYGKK